MNVTTVAGVLLVCWALILVTVVVFVARQFGKWDRADRDEDLKRRDDKPPE